MQSLIKDLLCAESTLARPLITPLMYHLDLTRSLLLKPTSSAYTVP
jgi:hypothetical protein